MVRKRPRPPAPVSGNSGRTGRILEVMPVKQEGGGTDCPLRGWDQAPFQMTSKRSFSGCSPDPPGSISTLLPVEAICLVTWAVAHSLGPPGVKAGLTRGLASVPTEQGPCLSLGEDLTCGPIQLQKPLWHI